MDLSIQHLHKGLYGRREERSGATAAYQISSVGRRRCPATWTHLPAVSTSHTSIKKIGRWPRERKSSDGVRRIRATSHPSHQKASSRPVPGLRARLQRKRRRSGEVVKDESVSGSNNKEVPPHTSFLHLSPFGGGAVV